MGLRLQKRMRIAPGLTVNVSPSGTSLSIGGRGARVTVGQRGTHYTVGLPGTGVYYTGTVRSEPAVRQAEPEPFPVNRLRLGWLRRLFTPSDEAAFVDALRAVALGDEDAALQALRRCGDLADAHYLAGVIMMKRGRLAEAAEHFESAIDGRMLGSLFREWKAIPAVDLNITPEITVRISPDVRGILLVLVELYQELGRYDKAQERLADLLKEVPDDPLIRLSAAELLLDMADRDSGARRDALELLLRMTDTIDNVDEFDTALMLYRARALRRLELFEGAKETLSAALRRKKGRSQHLLLELRYERALVYEAMGKKKQARKEFELIYGEDPGFRDVAQRLGVDRDFRP